MQPTLARAERSQATPLRILGPRAPGPPRGRRRAVSAGKKRPRSLPYYLGKERRRGERTAVRGRGPPPTRRSVLRAARQPGLPAST